MGSTPRSRAERLRPATATVAAILGGTLLLGVIWTIVGSVHADIERQYIPMVPLGHGKAWSNARTAEEMRLGDR